MNNIIDNDYNYSQTDVGKYEAWKNRGAPNATLSSFIITFFASILLFLLLCALLRNGDSVTFTSLLEFLSEQGTNFALVNYVDYSIVGDWGLFNFLKDFINLFMVALSLSVYLFKLGYNVIAFFFSLASFLFGW